MGSLLLEQQLLIYINILELNVEVDKLSKEALLLPLGLMEVKEYAENLLVNQYVRL